MNKIRCKWCNTNNLKYVEYHNKEQGQTKYDDQKILELLIQEIFQARLSWEIILNKENILQKYSMIIMYKNSILERRYSYKITG